MNKTELIDALSKNKVKRKDIKIIVEDLFRIIKDELAEGNNVKLVGFGSFNVVETEAQRRMNIQNNKYLYFKPSRRIKFRPSEDFMEKVSGKKEDRKISKKEWEKYKK